MAFLTLPRLPGPTAWFWRPPIVICVLLAYLGLHGALRFITSTVGVDDVEQVILAQSWDLGYNFRQPPLYTWLLAGLRGWLGLGLMPLTALRYGLLFLVFLFCYLAARRLPLAPRLAALCCFSLTLLFQIGWKMHVGVTHTIILSALVFATVWLLSRIVARPSGLNILLLGVVLGAGLLSKYGYVASLLLLTVPMLFQRAGRAALLQPGMMAVPAIALAMVAPYVYWVLAEGHKFMDMTDRTLNAAAVGWSEAAVPALGKLVGAVTSFVAPLFFLMLLMLPRLFAPLPKTAAFPDTTMEPVFDAERWLRWSLFLALAVLAAGAASGLATEFKERWMHPFLLPLPLWLFARLSKLQAARPSEADADRRERRLTWLWWALAVAALVAVLFRLGQDLYGEQLCGQCRLLVPFDRLAERIRSAGFRGGTIIAADEHIAGNLRLHFPKSRILTQRYPFYVPPPVPAEAGGQCLAVWNGADGETLPRDLDQFADAALDAGRGPFLPGEQVVVGERPVSGDPYVWYVYLDPDGRGACR